MLKKICKVLTSHGYTQIVSEPTHRLGHIFDWVPSCDDDLDRNIRFNDHHLSDHHIITIDLAFEITITPLEKVKVRNLKKIDLKAFRDDMVSSPACSIPVDVNELVTVFKRKLTDLLDQHAQIRCKKIRHHVATPLMSMMLRSRGKQLKVFGGNPD